MIFDTSLLLSIFMGFLPSGIFCNRYRSSNFFTLVQLTHIQAIIGLIIGGVMAVPSGDLCLQKTAFQSFDAHSKDINYSFKYKNYLSGILMTSNKNNFKIDFKITKLIYNVSLML